MALFPTNASQIQTFATALYGVQVGSTTLAQVNNDILSSGGLNNALNAYYTASFGTATTASVAQTIATNVGLGTDTNAVAFITAQLNAAAPAARGAAVIAMLDNFLNTTTGTYAAAAATFNTTVAAAVAYTGAANVAAGTVTPVTPVTFTLTTGVDTFAPGANSTINAILGTGATLNSFDSITAAGTSDTLNLSNPEPGTAVFSMPPSVTLSGLTTVNVSRVASGASTGAVTITDTTFGTGVQTLNYTDASIAANMTGAAASVTLNSANTVNLVASSTGTWTTVAVTDTSTTTTSTGSKLTTVGITGQAGGGNAITLTGNAINTVNLGGTAGATTITAAAGTRALTINATTAANTGGVTDATATSVTVNSGFAQAFGTLSAAKATSVTFNSTAATTAVVITAPVATSLTFGGTALTTLAASTDNAVTSITITGSGGVNLGANLTATSLTSINASAQTKGTDTITLGNGVAFTGGAEVDALTIGATTSKVVLGTGTNSTANLTVTALGSGGSVTGNGSAVLGLSDANAQTLSTTGSVQNAWKAAVTGFNNLALGAQTASTTIVDGGFATFTTASFTEGNNAFVTTLTNLPSGSTVNITGPGNGVTSTGGLTTAGSLGANATDSLTVGLISVTAAAAQTMGTITTPNLTNLTLVTSGSATANVGGVNTLAIADAALKVLTVSGTNGVVLGTLTGATGLTTIDASGLTGAAGISVTTAADQFATTIKGSSGTAADTINAAAVLNTVNITSSSTGLATLTGASGAFVNTITRTGTGASTIVGGAAADVISLGSGVNSVTPGTGADLITINHAGLANATTVIYGAGGNANVNVGGSSNLKTIANFTSGVDKIQLTSGLTTVGSLLGITLAAGNTAATIGSTVTDATSVATYSDVLTALATDLNNVSNAFAASAAGAGTIVAREVSFANGAAAGTYLVINDGTAAFQSAADIVIKLTGSTTFVAGDITVV